MTDERQKNDLLTALARMPKGSGIIFRHYSLAHRERRQLFVKVQKIARQRKLLLMLGGPPQLATVWGADGYHYSSPHKRPAALLRSAAAHNLPQIKAAEHAGAHFVFLSPVFPTPSHPYAHILGPVRFGLIARQARLPIMALGGMNAGRARRLSGYNVCGWGAIGAWSANHKH